MSPPTMYDGKYDPEQLKQKIYDFMLMYGTLFHNAKRGTFIETTLHNMRFARCDFSDALKMFLQAKTMMIKGKAEFNDEMGWMNQFDRMVENTKRRYQKEDVERSQRLSNRFESALRMECRLANIPSIANNKAQSKELFPCFMATLTEISKADGAEFIPIGQRDRAANPGQQITGRSVTTDSRTHRDRADRDRSRSPSTERGRSGSTQQAIMANQGRTIDRVSEVDNYSPTPQYPNLLVRAQEVDRIQPTPIITRSGQYQGHGGAETIPKLSQSDIDSYEQLICRSFNFYEAQGNTTTLTEEELFTTLDDCVVYSIKFDSYVYNDEKKTAELRRGTKKKEK
jgi:hypothetical protein